MFLAQLCQNLPETVPPEEDSNGALRKWGPQSEKKWKESHQRVTEGEEALYTSESRKNNKSSTKRGYKNGDRKKTINKLDKLGDLRRMTITLQ